MSKELYKTDVIAGIIKRIEHLEERVSILSSIADFKGHPFLFSVLEANLTKEEMKGVMDLMDKVNASLKTKKPMNYGEFERELYKIVPSKDKNFEFAKTMVMTLHDEGKWEAVYQHLKKDGMNI